MIFIYLFLIYRALFKQRKIKFFSFLILIISFFVFIFFIVFFFILTLVNEKKEQKVTEQITLMNDNKNRTISGSKSLIRIVTLVIMQLQQF
jgi:formate hydrogenlyase subunit 3/multisubunit Na+/H+ antiporter MnhD subunit